MDQSIIPSQYPFPKNQRVIVIYIPLFQSNTLQCVCYVFLHLFFYIPFSRLVHVPWKNFVWSFRSLLLYWLLNETHQAAQESLILKFFGKTQKINQISKKNKIPLGISLNFSNISNVQLLHYEIWCLITSI